MKGGNCAIACGWGQCLLHRTFFFETEARNTSTVTPGLLAEWLMRGRDGVIKQPGYRLLFYQLLLGVGVLAVLELGFPLGGGGAGGGFEDAVEGGFAGETRCQAHFSDLEVGVVAQ